MINKEQIEVSAIPSYEKQFKDASRRLADDEAQLLTVTQEIAALQKKKEQIEKNIDEDRKNKCNKGMLYYCENKRAAILDQAENLPYSKQTINRLRSIDNENWNSDHIDLNTIADFEAVEKYVNDNTPAWEQSPIAKLGKWFNQNRQE